MLVTVVLGKEKDLNRPTRQFHFSVQEGKGCGRVRDRLRGCHQRVWGAWLHFLSL